MRSAEQTEHIHPPQWDRLDPEDGFVYDKLLEALHNGIMGGAGSNGPGSWLMVATLVALRWRPDASALVGALPHFPESMEIGEIRATLARLGYPSTIETVTGVQVLQSSTPALIEDSQGRLWLHPGGSLEERLYAPDGDTGKWISRGVQANERLRLTAFRLTSRQTGNASDRGSESWSTEAFLRFAPEIRFVLLASFVSSCIAVLAAFGIALIFDIVLPSRNIETLGFVAAGFLMLLLVETGLRRMCGSTVALVSARIEYVFGTSLFRKVQQLPAPLLAASPVSAQLSRLKQFQSIREFPASPLAQAFYELPLAFVCFLAIALLAWQLALILVAVLAVMALLTYALARPLQRQSRRLSAVQAVANRMMQQIVVDRTQIIRRSMTDQWSERLDQIVREMVVERRRHARLTGWLNTLAHTCLPLVSLFVVGSGAILAMNGALSTGQLVGSTILTWRTFAVLRQFSAQLPRFWEARETLRQVDALMKLPSVAENAARTLPPMTRNMQLRVRNLNYRHPKAISPVITNGNFDIPFGSMISVTGPSGSGKTTLLRLLAGLIEPRAGAIQLEKLNLSQFSARQRSRYIAYVSQQPLLFYGSLAQNLRFADPLAPDGLLIERLEEVGLGDWTKNLPEGLETRLDPSRDAGLLRADVLTSFSIARALLTNPSVLLLDEPAGGLGADFESHMLAALERRRGNMTSVIVTHRPSIAQRTDAILEIQNGNIQLRAVVPGTQRRVAS